MILTAVHCVKCLEDWNPKGGMAMGDPYYEPLKTMAGKKLVGRVAFADPVSDVAVLTDTDDANKKKLEEFENFRDDTEPLPLCSDDFLKKHAEERTDDGGSWRYRCGNNCPRPHLGGFAKRRLWAKGKN